MKNLHLIKTDKPSKFYSIDGKHKLANSTMAMDWYISYVGYKPHNIYITSDEEIKDRDWYIYIRNCSLRQYKKEFNPSAASASYNKKIILTTDPELIKEGVQAIHYEFLEWFVKNQSCEYVEVQKVEHFTNMPYRVILPKEEPKQETLEEREPFWDLIDKKAEQDDLIDLNAYANGVQDGINYQQERMYSEEEVWSIINMVIGLRDGNKSYSEISNYFEKFKKK